MQCCHTSLSMAPALAQPSRCRGSAAQQRSRCGQQCADRPPPAAPVHPQLPPGNVCGGAHLGAPAHVRLLHHSEQRRMSVHELRCSWRSNAEAANALPCACKKRVCQTYDLNNLSTGWEISVLWLSVSNPVCQKLIKEHQAFAMPCWENLPTAALQLRCAFLCD